MIGPILMFRAARPAWGTRCSGGTGPSWTAFRSIVMFGSSGAARTTGSARASRSTGAAFRRHRRFRVQLGDGDEEETLRTLARNHHFPVFATFQDSRQAVGAEIALVAFLAVAACAGGIKQGFDILGKGKAGLLGSGWQFRDIVF